MLLSSAVAATRDTDLATVLEAACGVAVRLPDQGLLVCELRSPAQLRKVRVRGRDHIQSPLLSRAHAGDGLVNQFDGERLWSAQGLVGHVKAADAGGAHSS